MYSIRARTQPHAHQAHRARDDAPPAEIRTALNPALVLRSGLLACAEHALPLLAIALFVAALPPTALMLITHALVMEDALRISGPLVTQIELGRIDHAYGSAFWLLQAHVLLAAVCALIAQSAIFARVSGRRQPRKRALAALLAPYLLGGALQLAPQVAVNAPLRGTEHDLTNVGHRSASILGMSHIATVRGLDLLTSSPNAAFDSARPWLRWRLDIWPRHEPVAASSPDATFVEAASGDPAAYLTEAEPMFDASAWIAVCLLTMVVIDAPLRAWPQAALHGSRLNARGTVTLIVTGIAQRLLYTTFSWLAFVWPQVISENVFVMAHIEQFSATLGALSLGNAGYLAFWNAWNAIWLTFVVACDAAILTQHDVSPTANRCASAAFQA